jgi:hypothetical protein
LRRPHAHGRRRLLGLALIGLGAWLLGARAGVAGGCHAEDRPEFGLSVRLDATALPDWSSPAEAPSDPTGRVTPTPCRGETPGPPGSSPVIAEAVPGGFAAPVMPMRGPATLVAPEETRPRPLSRSEVPDRPPRPRSRAA